MKTIAQQLKITKFPFIINDDEGNQIYCEYLDGFWYKRTDDEKGNVIYYETSDGKVIDKRPKCENKVVVQQTAVEWLQKQIKLSAFVDRTQGFTYLDTEILFEMLAKAKEMEKEQIIKAHTRAYLIGEDNISIEIANERSLQYYNETFTSTQQT